VCNHVDNMYGSLENNIAIQTYMWVICIICYLYISYHHFID
jgi:hypothetical protein